LPSRHRLPSDKPRQAHLFKKDVIESEILVAVGIIGKSNSNGIFDQLRETLAILNFKVNENSGVCLKLFKTAKRRWDPAGRNKKIMASREEFLKNPCTILARRSLISGNPRIPAAASHLNAMRVEMTA